MAIRQLSLSGFRGLKKQRVEFHPHLNLVTGENGAGKTSLLEAIHIICQGRSFKAHNLDQCINKQSDSFVLFARFDSHKAGFSRNKRNTQIHVDGETKSRLSELVPFAPVRILNTESFILPAGTPQAKREFMDWCLFHVEHQYRQQWSGFAHSLKQRNALLKNKGQRNELTYWDRLLAENSLPIKRAREWIVNSIVDEIEASQSELINGLGIEIHYHPGWDTRRPLLEILQEDQEKDLKYGFTQHGLHRDTIRITKEKTPVEQVLSKGQIKRMAVAMFLAQVQLVHRISGKQVILLIDDISAELDSNTKRAIIDQLETLDTQIFVTSLDKDERLFGNPQDSQMFHVKHGMIAPV